jgi:RecB family exonuclease
MAARPRLPKLPRFSPTRLEAYRFCPRAYSFQYDQGLRWGGTSAGQSFGGSLHRALQGFHGEGGAQAVSVEDLKQKLAATWSAHGYGSPEEAAAAQQEGERLLEQHHAHASEEGRTTLAVECTVQHRYEDVVLFGKIDRLDRRPDGALEVIDYKSGRRIPTEDDVRGSLAMALYQMLVARNHPGVPVVTTLLHLRSGQTASVARSEDELREVEAGALALARQILADREKLPCPGDQCRDCPYPRVCPSGSLWLAQHPEVTG